MLHFVKIFAIFRIMAGFLKKIADALDGNSGMMPDKDHTCPYSEGCKRHYSPGDILRYAIVIALSVFLFLLVFSLFFPNIIKHPDMGILRELVNLLHFALHGSSAGVPQPTQ